MMMSLDAMHFGVHKWWEVVPFAYTYISSHKRVPMGGLPCKAAKDGDGCSFSVSAYNHKGVPMSCLQ